MWKYLLYSTFTATLILIVQTNDNVKVVPNFDSIRKNSALSTLIIDGNEWSVDASTISPQVFAKVPNIEELFIWNILKSLNKNIFTSLHQLKFLKIEYNHLNYIGPEVWSGLDLEKLSLRNNEIQELDVRAFDGLKASMIDLSNNNLRKLPNKCLPDLRLYKLTLANNKLEFIDLETFGPELAYLDLSNNLLTSLDVDIFSGIYGLLNLNLRGNKLTTIVAAPSLSRLRVLDVSHNEISIITGDAFVHYESLKELYLDHNKLFKLNHGSFPPNSPIKALTIDHNYLTGLSNQMLKALDNLAFLKFGGNPWSCKCLHYILQFVKSHRIGLDYCEGRLIQLEDDFCVEIYDKCFGNETQYISQNFDIYEDFIEQYQC